MSQPQYYHLIKHRASDVDESGYIFCPIAIYAKEGTHLRDESELCFVWTVHETEAGLDGIYVQRGGAETALLLSEGPNTILKQHISIGKAAKFLNYVCGQSATCRARFERDTELKEKADADEFEKQLDMAEEFYGSGKYSSTASRTGDDEDTSQAQSSGVGPQSADDESHLQLCDINIYSADLSIYADDELELGYPSDGGA
ncbi:hypothetical protein C8R43DRAFT_1142217 [Mycena crocata]|nr:hypothetical protein C8R43DRAFT_1142217 [Mycena crocata]